MERRAEVSRQTPGPGPTQGPGEPTTTTLRGRPLLLARAAWVIVAAAVLLLDAAGIPRADAKAREICTDPSA